MLHKHVCVESERLEAEVAGIDKLTCREAYTRMFESLNAFTRSRDATLAVQFAPLLNRIKETLLDDKDNSVEMDFHGLGRTFGFFSTDKRAEEVIDLFWASPGIADVLLGDDLLTPRARSFRSKYPLGLPSVRAGLPLRHQEEFGFFERDRSEFSMDANGAPDSPELKVHKYSYGLAHFLLGTVIACQPSQISMNDGQGRFRNTHAASACGRRLLELWSDPLVRSISGAGVACAPAYAFSVLVNQRELKDRRLGEDISPGIAIDKLLLALLGEIREVDNGITYAIDCIGSLTEQMLLALGLVVDRPRDQAANFRGKYSPIVLLNKNEIDEKAPIMRALSDIGMHRRAALALTFADHRSDKLADGVADRPYHPFERAPNRTPQETRDLISTFLLVVVQSVCVCGGRTPRGMIECATVMRAAANGAWVSAADEKPEHITPEDDVVPILCPAGKRFSGRAAFHFVLRFCSSVSVGGNPIPPIASLKVESVFKIIAELVQKWHNAKWPRSVKRPEDRALAKEKLACLDLCMPSRQVLESFHAMYGERANLPAASTRRRRQDPTRLFDDLENM